MLDSSLQLPLLLLSLILIISGAGLANKPGTKSVWLIICGAFLLRVFMAQLDPFLNLWDERYHALVAKNMLCFPLKPMLYVNPVLPYNFEDWQHNNIWLHKQPLFLWQIALFYKLFGVNEFVLRLPGVLMSTATVYFTFRLGKLLVNEKVGVYGAFLFALSFYSLELVSGVMSMEHNDTAFLFYTIASIWSWVEYKRLKQKRWLILIGIFSGCAILVKWLTGLLVFAGWGLTILASKQQRFSLKAYLPLGFSFIVSLVIFLPWQLYISYWFPRESAYEYAYNAKHIFEAVEGHGGTVWFHLQNLTNLYQPLIAFLIPIGLFLLFRRLKTNYYRIMVFASVFIIYFFFSVIVATKLPSYVFVIAPLLFLGVGTLLYELENLVKLYAPFQRIGYFVFLSILLLTGWFTLNINQIWFFHTEYNYYGINNYREAQNHNVAVYKSIPGMLWGEDYVIFNCKPKEHIELMYYSNLTGYDFVPKEKELQRLKAKKLRIAIFDDGKLPDYIMLDNSIFKIKEQLM